MYVSKIEDPEYFTIGNMKKLMELFHGEVSEGLLPEMGENVEHYVLTDGDTILAYAKILDLHTYRVLSELVSLPGKNYGLDIINDIFDRDSKRPIKVEVDITEPWLYDVFISYDFTVNGIERNMMEMVKNY